MDVTPSRYTPSSPSTGLLTDTRDEQPLNTFAPTSPASPGIEIVFTVVFPENAYVAVIDSTSGKTKWWAGVVAKR